MIRRLKATGELYKIHKYVHDNKIAITMNKERKIVKFKTEILIESSEELTMFNLKEKDYVKCKESVFYYNAFEVGEKYEYRLITGFEKDRQIKFFEPCLPPYIEPIEIEDDISEILFDEEPDNWTCLFSTLEEQSKDIRLLRKLTESIHGAMSMPKILINHDPIKTMDNMLERFTKEKIFNKKIKLSDKFSLFGKPPTISFSEETLKYFEREKEKEELKQTEEHKQNSLNRDMIDEIKSIMNGYNALKNGGSDLEAFIDEDIMSIEEAQEIALRKIERIMNETIVTSYYCDNEKVAESINCRCNPYTD